MVSSLNRNHSGRPCEFACPSHMVFAGPPDIMQLKSREHVHVVNVFYIYLFCSIFSVPMLYFCFPVGMPTRMTLIFVVLELHTANDTLTH